MSAKRRLVICLLLLVGVSLACSLSPAEARPFEHEQFTFTIPTGWKTHAEVWGFPPSTEQDYKGLGVYEIISIQYPPEKGAGNIFFVAASSPLESGQTLGGRFMQAYQGAVPEIEEISRGEFVLGDYSGFEILYKRPWGEPWWQFRDIWLEKDSVVYVLSFYTSPNSFDTNSAFMDQILGSFQFNN